MARTPLCDPGPDGPGSGEPGPDSPVPSWTVTDGAGHGWRPSCVPEDAPDWCYVQPPEEPDYDPGAVLDEIIARADAGAIEIPPDAGPESEPCFRGPVVVLGEPADLTAADLAGGAFRQGGRAATLPPGPALGALTGTAATDPRSLSDDELLGQIIEARRLQAHYEWEECRGIAEFARRQEEAYKASTDKGDRALRRQGEFGSEELGFALGMSGRSAGTLIDLAQDLQDRLPRTFAGLRDGTISGDKAASIHRRTWHLSDADAAAADEILAAAAPHLRPDTVDRKAHKLACELDPESAQRAKEEGKTRRRVEVRQEDSGNASLGIREADPARVLAARANIYAIAERLRGQGAQGSIDEIRSGVALDLLASIDPATGLSTPPPATSSGMASPADAGDTDDTTGSGARADTGDTGTPDAPGGGRAAPPVPALITILVPASTLLGSSGKLADAPGLGLLDPAQARDLVAAASRHPATRWCLTATDPATGEAVAHGCARGPHPWKPPPPGHTGDLTALLDELHATLHPIAAGPGDHGLRENSYRPSRKLAHLIRARTATCPAPGCEAHAQHSELDHTVPWPDGTTSEGNLSPPCARHHHAKHAPGWELQQTAPGVMRWTTPSGRTYTEKPTRYDL